MGFFSNNKSKQPKYKVGQMVMIKWRGQVGMIQEYDKRSGKYLVKPIDKGYAEFYEERELKLNY